MMSISHWGYIYVANTDYFWDAKEIPGYESYTEFGFKG